MDVGEIKAGRIWRKMGLTDQEYQMVVDALGRDPNWTELGMYAALWSEHCAYKHSRTLFHLFPTQSDRLLEGLGENAGIIDIGDGLAVCFKVESHHSYAHVEGAVHLLHANPPTFLEKGEDRWNGPTPLSHNWSQTLSHRTG